MQCYSNGPDKTCELLRKMEESADLFAFLEENCPIEDVLDNVHEVSKVTLECTCCIFGNTLWMMRYRASRRQRLKNKFRKFINRFVKAC